MKNMIKKIAEFSKISLAIFGFCSTALSVLIWIGVKVSTISGDFRRVVSLIPVVESNTNEIESIKRKYALIDTYNKDMDEIKQKYILTEVDFLINETLSRIYKKEHIGMVYVNRLIYYKKNLSFLTNQQISHIEYIERVAEKQQRDYSVAQGGIIE